MSDKEEKSDLACSCSCWFITLGVVFLLLWYLPVQLVVISPEVRIDARLERAVCTSVSFNTTSSRCCEKINCLCANTTTPDCDLQLQLLNAGPCGNGFRCCQTCCDTCTYVDQDGILRERRCNCRCCTEVANELCEIDCGECYTVTTQFKYSCTETQDTCCSNGDVPYTTQRYFGRDFDSMDTFRKSIQLNASSQCFYDNEACQSVQFKTGLDSWMWGVLIFPVTVIIFCLYLTTISCSFYIFKSISHLYFSILNALWCLLIIPLCLFLPIILAGSDTLITDKMKDNLIYAAFFFGGFGLAFSFVFLSKYIGEAFQETTGSKAGTSKKVWVSAGLFGGFIFFGFPIGIGAPIAVVQDSYGVLIASCILAVATLVLLVVIWIIAFTKGGTSASSDSKEKELESACDSSPYVQ